MPRSYFMCAWERTTIYMCKQELLKDFHRIPSSIWNCLFEIMFVCSSSATDAKQYKFLQTQLTSNFTSMIMFWQFKHVLENASQLQVSHFFGVALFNIVVANFNVGFLILAWLECLNRGSKVLGKYCCIKPAIKIGKDVNACYTGVTFLCDQQQQQVRRTLTGAFGGGKLPECISGYKFNLAGFFGHCLSSLTYL